MAFLKKQIVWLLLGLVLVVEIVFLVFLLDKQGEAAAKRKNLETKIDEHATLLAKNPGDPEVLKVLGQRKKDITRERADALLIFWARGQVLATLFPDVKDTTDPAQPKVIALAERDHIKPWQQPESKGVFLDSYQRLYNWNADQLDSKLQKIGCDRKLAWLAAPTGFTERTDLGIGDIYLEQMYFWIIKAVVEAADRAGVSGLEIGGIQRVVSSNPVDVKSLRENAKLTDTLSVKVTVMVQYPRLARLFYELLRSPVCFRIANIDDLKVAEPKDVRAAKDAREAKEAKEAREAKEAKERPAGEPEAAAAKAAAAPKGEYLVKAVLDCKVLDFNVAVRSVRFTGPAFKAADKAAAKAKVGKWIDKEDARVDAELKDKSGRQRWAAECQRAIDEKLAQVANEKDKEKAKAIAIILQDRLTFLQDRNASQQRKKDADCGILYDFDQQKEAAESWVKSYPPFETLALEARKELLGTVRHALDADQFEIKDGLAVTFYPDKSPGGNPLLDARQVFAQALDPDGSVQIEYGFVLFRPKENTTVVRRLAK